MKKIYDKLFLVIAVLFLSTGIYLYLKSSGEAPNLSTSITVELVDNPYEYEAIPIADSQQASWPEPIAQSAGPEWIYDVFTPPEIYIDQAGNFVPTGWKPAPPPIPFGVYLSDIAREPYRLQLEGYIEEDRTDPSKSLLLLFDEEADKQVRISDGSKPVACFSTNTVDSSRFICSKVYLPEGLSKVEGDSVSSVWKSAISSERISTVTSSR